MNKTQLKSLLQRAIDSEYGVKISCTDADILRRKFYTLRRESPLFKWLMFRISPDDSNELWVIKARPDKPITELQTRVILDDGTVVLDGNAVCYTMPIA